MSFSFHPHRRPLVRCLSPSPQSSPPWTKVDAIDILLCNWKLFSPPAYRLLLLLLLLLLDFVLERLFPLVDLLGDLRGHLLGGVVVVFFLVAVLVRLQSCLVFFLFVLVFLLGLFLLFLFVLLLFLLLVIFLLLLFLVLPLLLLFVFVRLPPVPVGGSRLAFAEGPREILKRKIMSFLLQEGSIIKLHYTPALCSYPCVHLSLSASMEDFQIEGGESANN